MRKLQALLPTIRDRDLHVDLAAMVAAHQRNIELVAAQLPAAGDSLATDQPR